MTENPLDKLKRWRFSTKVVPCMKEMENGEYLTYQSVEQLLKDFIPKAKVDDRVDRLYGNLNGRNAMLIETVVEELQKLRDGE